MGKPKLSGGPKRDRVKTLLAVNKKLGGAKPTKEELDLLRKNLKDGKVNQVQLAEETARNLVKGNKPTEAKKALTQKGPGKIHTKYYERIKKMDAKTKASYRTSMASLKASAIRGDARILNKPKGKETGKQRILSLREEQARRIAAYTSQCGAKSYILKYPSNHEYTIGCGEIFLCAQFLKIEKSDGTIVYAKRMKTPSGKYKGRLAFCTVGKPHEYVATYSGEKVTILDNVERVNVNDPKAVTAHVKILDQEAAARTSHATYFKKTEEVYRGSSYTPAVDDYKKGGKLDLNVAKGKGILAQMRPAWLKKLSATQRKSVQIIEQEFIKAGLTNPNLIAAAIVNAYKESSLRPSIQSCCKISKRGWNERGFRDSKGKLREDSWGLFQMNAAASVSMKKGMTESQKAIIRARRVQFRADMRDPVKNCAKVIKRIKSWRGRQLLAASAAGMGVPELARLFTIHIEICANRFEVGKQRGRFAMKMFKNSERPKEKSIIRRFAGPPWGKKSPNGRIRIKPGQKKWVIGSSTISGSCQPYLGKGVDSKIGHIGIGAYHAGRMLKFLKGKFSEKGTYWEALKNMTPPSTIILAGFALNSIGKSGGSDAAVVNKSIKRHKALKKFFEDWGKAKGVQVRVLVATNQEHNQKGPIAQRRIAMFNQRLRDEGLTDNSVDLAKKMKEKGWGVSSDKLHLGRTAAKGFVDMIARA
jgi:hypothetical protein